MPTTKQLLKFPAHLVGIVLLSLTFTTNSFADWYDVKILKISPRSASGDVFIQVAPGVNETKFTVDPSRVILLGTDKGTSTIMDLLLTAISLNSEVSISVARKPTWVNPQIVTSVGFTAP